MAVRPLTRNQQLQHRAFLKALARTGNVRMAATEVGLSDATLHNRRRNHPAFAQRWEATLIAARARLHRRGGAQGAPGDGLRAAGGEATIALLKDGRLQVRAARRDSLTKQCEQAFLAALSVTANVSLSAATAGASVASFNRRRRRDPGFAREVRMALAAGVARLEEALIAGYLPDSHDDDGWRHNDAPDLPRMSAAQALQLLYLHQAKADHARRGGFATVNASDPATVRRARLANEYGKRVQLQAEDAVTEELKRAVASLPRSPHETPPALPDLNQVTGWSAADPAKTPHGDRALFGGWRAEHQTAAEREAALAKGRAVGRGNGARGHRRTMEAVRIEAAEAAREAAERAAADARAAAALRRGMGVGSVKSRRRRPSPRPSPARGRGGGVDRSEWQPIIRLHALTWPTGRRASSCVTAHR